MIDDWDDVSYVISSRYRVEVLDRLAEGPSTPSTIADETGNSIAHVSRALGDLREHELVDLLVSEERTKGRVYGTTDKGETVWETIQAENLV
jgi:DNA-binding transcriptional ArsR family regulator